MKKHNVSIRKLTAVHVYLILNPKNQEHEKG